jgi:nucleoside phosphorylase
MRGLRPLDPKTSATRARVLPALAALGVLLGCGSDSNDLDDQQFIAAFAAFPAELQALVDRAEIEEEVVLGDRVLRLGRLGGVRVVLAMTGIGLINAERTTRAVLDRYAVTGVIVSGVSGGPHRIGDVTIPEAWAFDDGTTYECHTPWLAFAEQVAASALSLDRCTVVPASGQEVCLEHEPAVIVGGVGVSDDPFGGNPLPCMPNSDDVFGCDLVPPGAPSAASDDGTFAGPHSTEPAAVDMETTAIAREAIARGLPFVAFRALSDGSGDPLNLPGFPVQFFAYYRLAASTAAETATAFLQRIAASD